ncbi:glutathione S-transferase family protein [Roseovarius sp. D0-M9]|uniref:glutathione S-transferase family protein n=1 Tax=Roseovarius sp. D0-M9 TaxID=3127117 RepID=UPI00300F9F44
MPDDCANVIHQGTEVLRLHYAPDNASLVLRLALEEAGLPYETILVDRSVQAQKSPEYLALNPTGLIPTLITPQGPLAETAACLLWLCDTYPEANLGPLTGDSKRGMFLRWLFFLSNTVHADLIRLFYPDRYVAEEIFEVHHATMADRLSVHFSILDAAVRAEPVLFAPSSALAMYIGPVLRWSALYPKSGSRWLRLQDYPALHDLIRSLETRSSVLSAAAAEGLGNAPFSKPLLPIPPEGSAT